LTNTAIVIVIVGGVLGFIGFIISLICVAMISGFVRSTHTVQYLPHDNAEVFSPTSDIAAENEKAILDSVGRKKKDRPTVIEPLDQPLEDIIKSDIGF